MNVSVIGGGLIGLLSALRAQQQGAHVTVYEKSHIGQEASWAAAGLLAPLAEHLSAYAVQSRDAYPKLLAELGGNIPYAKCGLMLMQENRWLPDEAWVDPRALLAAVHKAALRQGVVINEGVQATLDVGGDVVVVAAGAWSQKFGAAVKPMKGVLMRLKAHLPHIFYWHDGYAVPRTGGECIVGATMEDAGFDKIVSDEACRHILDRARAFVPALRDAPVLDRWAGLRPAADAPILKREGRIIYATGHFRNGILLAPYTADWVASALATA